MRQYDTKIWVSYFNSVDFSVDIRRSLKFVQFVFRLACHKTSICWAVLKQVFTSDMQPCKQDARSRWFYDKHASPSYRSWAHLVEHSYGLTSIYLRWFHDEHTSPGYWNNTVASVSTELHCFAFPCRWLPVSGLKEMQSMIANTQTFQDLSTLRLERSILMLK